MISLQAASNRWDFHKARTLRTYWPVPSSFQRIPEHLSRWVTRTLLAASTTPEPIGSFRFWNAA